MSPVLVDSHAHLDDSAFQSDLEAVLSRARENGVHRIVTIGTDLASSRRALAIAESQRDVWFSPGIHPHEADNPGAVDDLRPLAAHPRAVAVGETGLDYVKQLASIPKQRELFTRHLEIALEADKPVSIHCREAHGDLFPILRGHAPLRGVIHCFSGETIDVENYLSLNFFLSIAGPVTYPKADRLRDVVRHIPLDRLLVETDCPLLAPQKYRGKRNEPAYVRETVVEVAACHGITPEELAEATTRNAVRLFGFPQEHVA
jgi:TatD DNase family protein